MKAAVIVDDWKLPVFDRALKAAGYAYENAGSALPDTTVLLVLFESDSRGRHLAQVITEANLTAAQQQKEQQDARHYH